MKVPDERMVYLRFENEPLKGLGSGRDSARHFLLQKSLPSRSLYVYIKRCPLMMPTTALLEALGFSSSSLCQIRPVTQHMDSIVQLVFASGV